MATLESWAPSIAPAKQRKPGPKNTAGIILVPRCPEMTRTERGYERCHLDEHGPEVRHHVRDRSWRTGTRTPCLQLGQPCGEACKWPDQVALYLWHVPNANAMTVMARARRKPGRPPRGPTSASDAGRSRRHKT
jgi:hypothetical protein